MTLQSAARTLNADLGELQTRMEAHGWPVRARLLGTGVTGNGDGNGIFVRLQSAGGEEYVFTMSGPRDNIERFVNEAHRRLSRFFSESWPEPVISGSEPLVVGYDAQEIDPRARRRSERSMVHAHTFTIQRRPDGLWTASVAIPTPAGPLYLCATADEHAVAQALQGELSAVSRGRDWSGNPDFRIACGEVARGRVEDRLGSSMRSFVRDPGAQAAFNAASFIPVIGPIASLAFQGTRAALDVVDRAKAGDPRTRARIAAMARAAKSGDKRAREAIDALRLAAEIRALKGDRDALAAKLKEAVTERDILQAKIKACDARWTQKPLDAADDYIDQWGGADDFTGPDLIAAASGILLSAGTEVGASAVTRSMLSRYARTRLPAGEVRHACTPEVAGLYQRTLARPMVARHKSERFSNAVVRHEGTPEIAGLIHRPMRESGVASARAAYLRGTALQGAGFPTRRLLAWPR